jgi:hypothetical protein
MSDVLPLERRPGIGESSPLLLELPLGPLAGGTLLPELVLRRGERGDLGVEGGLQLVGLLGLLLGCPRPLLGPALLGLRLLEPRVELPVLGPDGPHLRLPVRRHSVHLLHTPPPPRLLQRLIPIDEGCANPLKDGGTRRGLTLVLQELVSQGLRPVRQLAVFGPQGLRERVEGIMLLPEVAELGTHLVERAILVAGAMLELLPPTDQNQ